MGYYYVISVIHAKDLLMTPTPPVPTSELIPLC